MRILYLAHRIPYPPNKGDKIRSFNEIKYLSKNNEIYLVCLVDDPDDLKHENVLKNYCKSVHTLLINHSVAKLKSLCYLPFGKPLTVPYFYSAKIQKKVNSIISSVNIDVIFCFSSPMAEYIFRAENYEKTSKTVKSVENGKLNRTRAKLIMDFVDVDSDKWLQYSTYTRFPYSWLYRLESEWLAVYERKISMAFDYSIFVSDKEAELFKTQNPQIENVQVISNGVDSDYFNPDTEYHFNQKSDNGIDHNRDLNNDHGHMLLFTGAMDYYANVDGVVWFCNHIFPEIKRKFPSVQFYIVGSRPDKKVQKLMDNDGVIVTGFVEDTRTYYQKADVCVIPLRIARGIQNKILEAMAFGKPVVATLQAFAGINAIPGTDIEVAKDMKDFETKTIRLLGDEKIRTSLGINGRNVAKTHYDWSTNVGLLESIMRDKEQVFLNSQTEHED